MDCFPAVERKSLGIHRHFLVCSLHVRLGSLSTAYTSEKLGRLRSIQISCVVCVVGGALMTGAVGVPMFLISRFIMGWGVGMVVCGSEKS